MSRRKRRKNLRCQLRTAVFDAFRENLDKHSLKKESEGSKLVFSYGTRNQLLDRITDFCKYTDKRNKEDITKEDVIKYLDIKAANNCSQRTLDEYRSELKKIGLLIDVDLSVQKIYANKQKVANRGAESVMTPFDYNILEIYMMNRPCGSGICIMLEKELGIRVSDMAYGIQIDGDILKIRCKNGKILERPITPNVREIMEMKQFKKMLDGNKVRAPKDNSINKYLLRVQRRIKMDEHSFHDIRRMVAQEHYDALRKDGMGRSEALEKTSIWLNHGPNREKMMLESYIANAW